MGRRLWIGLAALGLALGGGLYGCVAVGLPDVALSPRAQEASPPVLAAFGADPPVGTAEDWRDRRAPLLREAFLREVYGAFPAPAEIGVASRRVLDPAVPGAITEQWQVSLNGAPGFGLLLVLPEASQANGPVPLVIMQNFCGNPAVYPELTGIDPPRAGAPGECGTGWARPVISAIFGDAILTPPTAEILSRGYGLAIMFGGEIAPDSAEAAESALTALTPPGAERSQRTGAIAAWAWGYLAALEALSTDPRIDHARISLWGHSRNGKAALLAAALDPRPAAVIALQPGTGGGSLQRDAVGESIAQITESYPHWFAPAYASWAGREAELSVDQHQLLALIAPRPVLMGAARRDRWSDPHGAWLAARAASSAWELLGAGAFTQTDLRKPDLSKPLVTYMRGGLHGVHGQDWDIALDFLDRHVRPQGASAAAR